MKNNGVVMEVCGKCGNDFELGYNGLYMDDDTLSCDTCAGVKRDADGNAWLPGEDQILWEDGTVTTRAEAFGE